ncbi:hypothetical protein BZA05DRAFT_355762 [Tricharina praecox]|uniref:uncharacterized protein n=1 Tax=Tricharina praecox TaxID=43433 RepID=UPI002220E8BA|nr:uncharacterized protein BZA05DRAFT_355762 [Tricharina praecox]KAI5848968.1 hypothetical protein BZA05DRAFT_355762 [Tricharina praecox]
MAASGRPLGLGSRANLAANKAALMSGALVKKSTTTVTTTTTTKPARRGFGLFDSDNEFDSDTAEPVQKAPVRFTGDRSAFANMSDRSDSEGGASSRNTKSSSRKSRLTTPSKKIASRRGTPYHPTSRARRFQSAAESGADTDDEKLISESMFGDSPAPISKKKARFALANSEDEREESTELDTDQEQKTPIRNRRPSRPKPVEKSNQQSEETVISKTTWGQWLRSIVTHPVATLLTTHAPTKNDSHNHPKTPETEYRSPAMPGSFEKSLTLPPPPLPLPADETIHNHNNGNTHNGNYRFFNRDTQNTPVRNADGLFQHGISPFNMSSPASTASNGSASPASAKKGSRALTAPIASRRMAPPAAVTSYRKPSNFIARMRGETKQKRFDPYSRPSSTRRKRGAPVEILPEEITKDLTPEEELDMLERREKDRKVQEAEDRYLRREALRRMGKIVEDEEMSDTPTESKKGKGKGKGKVATVDDMDDDEDDRAHRSNTPPDSPPHKLNGSPLFQNLAPKGSPPLFQFVTGSTTASTSEKRAPVELNSGERYAGFASLFPSETDSDKENVHNPPPPPTMSHRELPAAPIPAPAPPASGTSLFPEKQPVGGFGISEGPVLQPTPVSPSMTRQRFDKFKPRVSSGLRESATIEKENEQDKENPSENFLNPHGEGPSSSGGKPSKAAFGTQVVSKPSTQISSSSALREVGRNASAGTGVKVDIGGKIAAVCPHPTSDSWHASLTMVKQLPVEELSALIAWPGVEVFTTADTKIQEAVRAAWKEDEQEWLGEWANGVFGEASAMVTRV